MTRGMRILVTGSSGHFAAALLPALCALHEVREVRGIDFRPPRFRHEKFRAVVRDIRDPALIDAMTGCDALVHLAFVVLRGRTSERAMREINISGTGHLFATARRCGLPSGQQEDRLVQANLLPIHVVVGSVNSLSDAHFGRKDEWVSCFF